MPLKDGGTILKLETQLTGVPTPDSSGSAFRFGEREDYDQETHCLEGRLEGLDGCQVARIEVEQDSRNHSSNGDESKSESQQEHRLALSPAIGTKCVEDHYSSEDQDEDLRHVQKGRVQL